MREQRGKIADEFNSIVEDYTDYLSTLGQKDERIDKFSLHDLSRDFRFGSKSTYFFGEGRVFVLPIMRETIQTIIAANTHLTERCEAMLTQLSGPYAMGLEPTEDELNPPPEPAKELRISLGDTVYIGSQAYEVLSLGDDEVKLSDLDYPLFTKTFPRADFERMVMESPLNDHLLHEVEEEEPAAPEAEAATSEKQYDLGFGYIGNGLSVWNRLEEEHGDYKNVAHINVDRTIDFYDMDMPEGVKAQIRKVAETDTTFLNCQTVNWFDEARTYMNEFYARQYGGTPEQYGNLSDRELISTTLRDGAVEVRVSVDLVNDSIKRYLNGRLVEERKYDSLRELTDVELKNLDYEKLTAFSDAEIKAAMEESREPKNNEDGNESENKANAPAEKEQGNELWQAYSRVKAEHDGSIVMYQVGDFYWKNSALW